jgi:hypothetical protein
MLEAAETGGPAGVRVVMSQGDVTAGGPVSSWET